MDLINSILNGLGNVEEKKLFRINGLSFSSQGYTPEIYKKVIFYILRNENYIKKIPKKVFAQLISEIENMNDGSIFEIDPRILMPKSIGELVEMSDGNGITNGPIDIFVNKNNNIVISDGHHRWHEAMRKKSGLVKVRKTTYPGFADSDISTGISFSILDKREATNQMKKFFKETYG